MTYSLPRPDPAAPPALRRRRRGRPAMPRTQAEWLAAGLIARTLLTFDQDTTYGLFHMNRKLALRLLRMAQEKGYAAL